MKLLVVDVGNTSTALGLWSDGRVLHVAHVDGPAVAAQRAAGRILSFGVDAIAYASVVPKADRSWAAFAKSVSRRLVSVNYKTFSRGFASVTLDYPKPDVIGADRLADAAGAVERYGVPIMVLDFGTALTAAVVTEDRVWRGGVIAPGLPLMRDYLFERTAKLPRMALGKGKIPKIGRTTEEAMRFGALVGARGMVREIVSELKRNFKSDFRLIATGGYAKWVLRDFDLPFLIDPTLTLAGVGLICARSF